MADIEWLSWTQGIIRPAASILEAEKVSENQPRESPKRAGIRIRTSGILVVSIFMPPFSEKRRVLPSALFGKECCRAAPPWTLATSRAYRGKVSADEDAMFGTVEKTESKADLIKDGTEATFMKDVIEQSKTIPVIEISGRRGADRAKR